jgi:nucleoside-diphosphate-sugar epimerase
MKKILITGANSYIGTSFEKWLKQWPEDYLVDTVDMIDGTWREKNFSGYDVVFHVAGIAHIKETKENVELYYKVNRDLVYEIAKKAKDEGVKQFIFLSSMSVYGMETGVISKDTVPIPKSNYGKSKLQAEELISPLQDSTFNIAVLRPPMIYGKGCKGNYQALRKIALNMPLFPKVNNKRSMIYIYNLCNFIKQLIDTKKSGLFTPQNCEYVNTSEIVKFIAEANGRNMHFTKAFNWTFKIIPGDKAEKAFGSLIYKDDEDVVNLVKFKNSVFNCESKRILILANIDVSIYNTRRELVQLLIDKGYEVYISCLYGERVEKLKDIGCTYIETDFLRHGTNPFSELKLINFYRKIIKDIKPSIVLTYSVKQNIYGGIAANLLNTPYIANITGLGPALENDNTLRKITLSLYRYAFRKVKCVFFQNKQNLRFFEENSVRIKNKRLIPGSGVNLYEYVLLDYPNGNMVNFLYLSRVVKEKGIDQYLEAASAIRKKYPNTRFHICGFCEDEYKDKMHKLTENGDVVYHGMISDTKGMLKSIHCTIHPSFYPEGMSNVLLESCACGRPVITTRNVGCQEVVDEGKNGYLVNSQNSDELIKAIDKFMQLTFEEKKQMGLAGRNKVEKEFDRQIVVEAYLNEIGNINLREN